MGFSSQAGQVGFKTQATPGAYSSPGTDGVFMRTRSGSLGPDRELLVPDPEIGGNRDISDAYLGAIAYSGEYEFYARSRSIATLLYAALGAKVSAPDSGSGAHLHTITPVETALPWLSIEENIGGNFETFEFTDAKVNTLHLEAEANGYLQGTVGMIARMAAAGATKTPTPAVDTNPMLVGTNITVTYNGVTLPAKSFSLDISNNMEDDDFRLGSFFLGSVVEKQREITMGVGIRPSDSTIWRQATFGTPAATQPGGLTTKQQAVITIDSYEDIGASGQKHRIQITVPKAVFVPFTVEPSGDDVLEHDLELRALRPDPAVPIITATVRNELAAVA
jgi:hypothetical protein